MDPVETTNEKPTPKKPRKKVKKEQNYFGDNNRGITPNTEAPASVMRMEDMGERSSVLELIPHPEPIEEE